MNSTNKIRQYLRTIFFTVMSALFLQACNQKIDARQAHTERGLIYKKDANDPFTGVLTNMEPNDLGIPIHGSCEVNLKDGLFDGLASCNYDKGTKFLEIDYKNGKYDGDFKIWDFNTQKLISKIQWKNGLKDGIEEKYDASSGKLISQVRWSANKIIGDEQKRPETITESPNDSHPTTQPIADKRVDECVDKKIADFRKANGPDEPIIDDVIQEWKANCK